jgi:hypothetical protein
MRVAIILLLVSTSAFGQVRGGARMGFGGGRVVQGGRPGVFIRPGFHGGGGPFIPQAGRPFFPGVPARVPSGGACGFTPCFNSGFVRFGHFGHFHHGFARFGFSPFFWGGGFVSAYPYAYPFYGDYDYAAGQQEPAPTTIVQQPALPQTLEVTIVDKRDEQNYESEPATPARGKPRQRLPAIFIFKDGWRKELGNYAISRGQLIDVTNGKVFRVPLDNIDWPKTFEANQRAGRKITLP